VAFENCGVRRSRRGKAVVGQRSPVGVGLLIKQNSVLIFLMSYLNISDVYRDLVDG
jgi:hypothetical protein